MGRVETPFNNGSRSSLEDRTVAERRRMARQRAQQEARIREERDDAENCRLVQVALREAFYAKHPDKRPVA